MFLVCFDMNKTNAVLKDFHIYVWPVDIVSSTLRREDFFCNINIDIVIA